MINVKILTQYLVSFHVSFLQYIKRRLCCSQVLIRTLEKWCGRRWAGFRWL